MCQYVIIISYLTLKFITLKLVIATQFNLFVTLGGQKTQNYKIFDKIRKTA